MATQSNATADHKSSPTESCENSRYSRAVARARWYTLGNTAAGLVPFPLIDMVAITTLQVLLLKDLANIYEVPYSEQRGKVLVGALTSGVAAPVLVGPGLVSLLKAIPGIGQVVAGGSMAVIAAASTHALSKVFIQHFEAGGTLLDFDPEAMRKHYMKYFEEAKQRDSKEPQAKATEDTTAAPATARP